MAYGDPPLGNRFFVNTGGVCTAPDGSLQSRYNFIDNVSGGLIPGVVSDIGGLNPTYLMKSLTADSYPSCKCYKCPVSSGNQFQYLSPDLSPDLVRGICQEVAQSNCPDGNAPRREGFANTDYLIPIVIAGIAVCAVLLVRTRK
jgi:hypothetical protein